MSEPNHPLDHAAAASALPLSDSMGRNTTVKLFLLCLLCLLLLIPLGMVQSLVSERREMKQQAERRVADGLSYQPKLVTPYLVVSATDENVWEPALRTRDLVLVASALRVTGSLQSAARRVGIFDVPTYSAELTLSAEWDPETLARIEEPTRKLDWRTARIEFALSEPRGLRKLGELQLSMADPEPLSGAATLSLEPLGRAFDNFHSIGSKLGWSERPHGAVSAVIKLQQVGTHALELVPLARRSEITWSGNWPHPSYVAGLLPEQQEHGKDGFQAHWLLTEFNLGLPKVLALKDNQSFAQQTLSVQLYQPSDVYQRSERSVKYGALIIGLAVLSFFLAEVLLQVRLHPVHYGLIGMTLAVFYLLLLALSELIGFTLAFTVAAGASCLLLGAYSSAILHGVKRGSVATGALALVYGYSFVLVTSESLNLLMGAIGLVLLLGFTMYLTRRIDWYARLPGPG